MTACFNCRGRHHEQTARARLIGIGAILVRLDHRGGVAVGRHPVEANLDAIGFEAIARVRGCVVRSPLSPPLLPAVNISERYMMQPRTRCFRTPRSASVAYACIASSSTPASVNEVIPCESMSDGRPRQALRVLLCRVGGNQPTNEPARRTLSATPLELLYCHAR